MDRAWMSGTSNVTWCHWVEKKKTWLSARIPQSTHKGHTRTHSTLSEEWLQLPRDSPLARAKSLNRKWHGCQGKQLSFKLHEHRPDQQRQTNGLSGRRREIFVQFAETCEKCVFLSVRVNGDGRENAEIDKTCSVSVVKDRCSPLTPSSASRFCKHTAPLCLLVLWTAPFCLFQQRHCSLTRCTHSEQTWERAFLSMFFYLSSTLCVNACAGMSTQPRRPQVLWECVRDGGNNYISVSFPRGLTQFCRKASFNKPSAVPLTTPPSFFKSL